MPVVKMWKRLFIKLIESFIAKKYRYGIASIIIILATLFLYKYYDALDSNKTFEKSHLFNFTEPHVRVRIINTIDTLHIILLDQWSSYNLNNYFTDDFKSRDSLVVTVEAGKVKVYNHNSNRSEYFDSLALKPVESSAKIEIKNVPYGVGWWWAGEEDRVYEGEIYIYPGEENIPEVVVKLPLEDYLYGVVPYEIGGDSPDEALKAQAIAARSEAVIALTSKLYSGLYHDLIADVECQVFSGNKKRTAASDGAVDKTRGIIISENEKPINAYYASNCGGHSELITNVWPDRPDPESYRVALSDTEERIWLDISSEEEAREWILSEPDVYCNPNLATELPVWSRKNFRWRREFTTESITKMIAGDRHPGSLVNIVPLKRGSSGRIILARFIFEKDSIDVSGELSIRQLWKPSLRSACFVVDKESDKFILNGAGWGHGVGMCQTGAVAQANNGKDFVSILNHYYQKAELIALY